MHLTFIIMTRGGVELPEGTQHGQVEPLTDSLMRIWALHSEVSKADG